MDCFKTVTSNYVVIENANIDTDQIIPAQFLKTTSRDGLGKHLFAGWRYNADGSENSDFVLNQPASKGAEILVAGDNFGCGSSREHAPWALLDYGFRVVISTKIADIFRNNSQKNGLLPIVVDADVHAKLLADAPGPITADLEQLSLKLADGSDVQFEIEPFARHCLLNGVDQMTFLLDQSEAIERFERERA